jgi:hypothetical protein
LRSSNQNSSGMVHGLVVLHTGFFVLGICRHGL